MKKNNKSATSENFLKAHCVFVSSDLTSFSQLKKSILKKANVTIFK